ncbi:MAG: hypothetical protein ACK6C7_20060 [Pseudanabaena sp.]
MTIIILVNFKLFKIVRYPVKRLPLTTHKTRSPIPSNQTAIAPHHPQNPIAYSHIKQRSPLSTHKTRSPFPSTSNSDRLSSHIKPNRQI